MRQNMIEDLIDIHLNGDIDLKKIEKEDYYILYSEIVPDIDYNYAYLKNNNVDIEDVIKRVKEDFKLLNRKPTIYILSNIMNDKLKSKNLEINHIDTWMVLDKIVEFKTNLNIEYNRLKKEEITNICLQTEKGYYPEKLYSKIGFNEVLQGTFYNIL